MNKKLLTSSDEQTNVTITQKRLVRILYLLPLAFVMGLIAGVFVNLKVGLIVLGITLCLWGVCTYIAFMHYWAAKDQQKKY